MYALIENNVVTQVGELATLFPNTSNANASFAQEQGALEVVEGEQKDQRFYWVTFSHYEINGSVVTRTYTNTPKALEDFTEIPEGQTESVTTKGLKSNQILQVKITANSLLASTDWMVIRKVERNVDIPSNVITKRAAILTECDRLISAINASTTMEEFIAITPNWGE
jgi:hypothetical protein